MPLRFPSSILNHSRCLLKPSPYISSSRHPRHLSRVYIPVSQRSPLSTRARPTSTSSHADDASHNPSDPIAAHRVGSERRSYYTRRNYFAATGAALCMIATLVLVSTYELPPQPERNDAPPRPSQGSMSKLEPDETMVKSMSVGGAGTGGVIVVEGSDDEAVEQVPTGTSTIPFFPKSITLPSQKSSTTSTLPSGTGDANETYQLIGLGIRTVSFLSIQVYVVGLYIATSDVATLQSRMVHKATGVEAASTLVAGEREDLRKMLLDPEGSERIWDEVLRKGGLRTVLRIVPTRKTDFGHLRDGFVRSITSRSQGRRRGEGSQESYEDEGFGKAVGDFKAVFSGGGMRGSGVSKGKVLLLVRESNGNLAAWVEGDKKGMFARMGDVRDERISRLVWLGYLAGKEVASDDARKSIVEGVMEFVERPIGTVETQVV